MKKHSEVVLIEDNPHDAELITMVLQSKNITAEVVWFKDGEEVIQALQSGILLNYNPKLILLDLKLPKVEGVKVLKEIKAHQHARLVPVVVLTSSSQESDRLSSYQSGANSYVVKPIDYNDFEVTIEEVGSYWLYRNTAHD